MKDLSKIDWRALQRLTNSQAIKDFDKFLDALPMNAGYNALIAAGIAWAIAGGAVLFASMEVEKVTQLRAEMMKIEALQPPIPVLKYSPVPRASIESLAKKIESTYSGIKIASAGDGDAIISGADTDYFPQFMAGISTMQNGGKNWKVNIKSMCAGRDCKASRLSAALTIEAVRVDNPPPPAEEED